MEQNEQHEAPEAENALEGADGQEMEAQDSGEHSQELEDIQEAQEPARDYEKEAEARKYGWRHKSEYTNDPKGWVDADRFLELPSTQNKKLRDEMKSRDADFQARMANMERMNKVALERQKAMLEADISRISQQQMQAVETADTATYQQLETQKQDLMRQAQEVQPQQQAQGPDPYVEQYRAENAWTQNPALWQQAISIVGQNQAIQQMSARDQVQYAEGQIRQLYPHFFQDSQPAPQPKRQRVDGGGMAPAAPRASKAAKLPPEARKAGEQFVAQGLFKNLEEYAKVYHEE